MTESYESYTSAAGDGYLDDGFSELVHGLLKQHHVPGMSIAVVDKGKVYAEVNSLERQV